MTIIVVFDGGIDRAAIVTWCDRTAALLERVDTGPVICDVGAVTSPDAVVIEAIARLQLTALGLGSRIVLRDANEALDDLLSLTGLRGSAGASVVETVGQPEEREDVGGVEEEADAGDPIA